MQIVCASPYDRRRPQVRGFVEDCAAPVDLYLEQFFFLVELDSALYKSAVPSSPGSHSQGPQGQVDAGTSGDRRGVEAASAQTCWRGDSL